MRQSDFLAISMFLLASAKSASSAFISSGDIGGENKYTLPNFEPEDYKPSPVKKESRFKRLEKSANQAQDILENFAHNYINKFAENDADKVTFFKLKGTDLRTYYGSREERASYVPKSITGKFEAFKEVEGNENLSSPYAISTGIKSFDRTLEKLLQNPNKKIKDLARLSVVTRRPEELFELCKHVCEVHNKDKENSPFAIDKKNPAIIRGWSKKDSGFFSAKLNVPIKTDKGKVYSEIMFVPEHKQSRMAVDILSHTAYEVARKDSKPSYSSDSLRKWNIVVSKVKSNNLANLDRILDDEVHINNGVGPVTTHDFDINTMKALFSGSGYNNGKPIERRKTEMTNVQKELNRRVMENICSDENWSPQRMDGLLDNYSFSEDMVKIDPVKKYNGCDIDYDRLR